MSSADPTDVDLPVAKGPSKPSSKMGSGNAYEQATEEVADARSERPQAKPEDRKTDRAEPIEEPAQDNGPKGIKGAFQKHPIAMIVCLGLIAIGIIAGIAWYLHARHYESTDDAFIDGRPVLVSPQVTGNIIAVNVTDNQIVKNGDLLATIDPRNYKAAVDQAEGLIRQNEATLKNIDAQIAAQKAQVDQATQQVTEAQSALKFSTDENTRYQNLVQNGAG